MEQSTPAAGPFALRAWHDAAATVSLASVPDLTSALEHIAASVSRNVSLAFGRPARVGEKRTLDVLANLTRRLSEKITALPASVPGSLNRVTDGSAALCYRVSTTRIVDGDRTGVLIRLREANGSLIVDTPTICAILTAVDTEVRHAIAEVLAAEADTVSDYRFRPFDPDSSSIEVRRIVHEAGDSDRRPTDDEPSMVFERGILELRSSPAAGTEATIKLHFSGAP